MSWFDSFWMKTAESGCKNCKVPWGSLKRWSGNKTDPWRGSGNWFWGPWRVLGVPVEGFGGPRGGFWGPGGQNGHPPLSFNIKALN